MNQNVIRAAITVFGFWWLLLAIYGLVAGLSDPEYLVRSTLAITILVIAGIAAGVASVLLLVWMKKKSDVELLAGESVRGLVCTIGELPFVQREPERAKELPDLTKIPDVEPSFYQRWMDHHGTRSPQHAALLRALIEVFASRESLPATHIAGGHGGRTLLQHSLLVGYHMEKLGRTWTNTGLRAKSTGRIRLKLRDDNYKFNLDDPMITIIGVAHDIGKIESYIYDADKKVIGIHNEHDLTGARMIARLPEAWAIPDDDRTAMFLAIAHYHHPMELPLSPDSRAADDRTIALMELLIKADFVTSAVEAKGAIPTDEEYENAYDSPADAPVDLGALFNTLSDLIQESGRVNSNNRKFNIGTLCLGHGFEKPMLFIREDALRSSMYGRLKMSVEAPLGDGRYPLTVKLLRLLAEKGVLVQEYEGKKYKAENALWNVDFSVRPAAGAKPEKRAGWSAVIIVDPVLFPSIVKMNPYWWHAKIQRPTMGSARAAKSIDGKSPGTGTRALDTAEPEIEEIRTVQAEELNDQAAVQETLQEHAEDEAAAEGLIVTPRRGKKRSAANAQAQMPAPPAPFDQGAKPTGEPSSEALQSALQSLSVAMQSGTIQPAETDTHFVFTFDQLISAVPSFNWVACSPAVETLARESNADIKCVQADPANPHTMALGVPRAPTPPVPVEPVQDWKNAPWEEASDVLVTEVKISPENVHAALLDIVRRAEAGALEVPRQDQVIVMTAAALELATPAVPWTRSADELRSMCETGRVPAQILMSQKEGAGGFFLKVNVEDFDVA